MSSAVTKPVPVSPPGPQAPAVLPPEPKRRLPWKWLIVAAVVAVVVVAYALYSRAQQAAQSVAVVQVRTARATAGPIEVTTRITGQTAARNFANIIAPRLNGPEGNRQMLIEKLAPSGLFVKKGDVVAQMDGTSAREHILEVEDTVEQAVLDVSKRKAEQALDWEVLQQTLRVASSELDKARLDASAAEVRTVVDQELIKLAVEEAQARFKQLQGDIGSQRAVHQAELRILELTQERHRRHLNRHVTDIQRYTIRAPMDGLVVMQQVWRGAEMAQIEQGDQVFPGSPILKVVDTNSMQLEAQVNQAESSQLRIGQRARIRLDAFPGLQLDGRIAGIGALAAAGWRNSFYIRNVPVKVEIIGSDPRLIPDLSGSAEIILEKVEKATLIPRPALIEQNGKTVVYVKKGTGFELRPVEVGVQNTTHAAITSGLTEGEEVRLN